VIRASTIRRSWLSRAREIRPRFFHAVQEPGDVWITRNHAAGKFPAGNPLRRPSQDAKDVVLSEREILGLQHAECAAGQHIGRAEQFQECRPFRAAYPMGFAGLGHAGTVFVLTTIVKTYVESLGPAVLLWMSCFLSDGDWTCVACDGIADVGRLLR
jgi:hypothetical protein